MGLYLEGLKFLLYIFSLGNFPFVFFLPLLNSQMSPANGLFLAKLLARASPGSTPETEEFAADYAWVIVNRENGSFTTKRVKPHLLCIMPWLIPPRCRTKITGVWFLENPLNPLHMDSCCVFSFHYSSLPSRTSFPIEEKTSS